MAGVNIVGGVDLWKPATDSFKLNFPEAEVFNCDIRKLAANAVSKKIGSIDLLLSSPECTHHTCARGNKPRSEESKETALQVLRFARVLKPRWVVLENVVHMRPWGRYPELKEKLSALGYKLNEQVLNAADFGVPQSRRRLFLMGDLIAPPPKIVVPDEKILTVREILDPLGTWKMQPLITESRAKGTLERAQRALKALGPTQAFLLVYYGTDGSGGWQPLDIPLRTVTTVDRFALVVPTLKGHMMRMLQPSEIRRAMGFPHEYKFPDVSRRDRIKLLGNAVCSPVMAAIIDGITGDEKGSVNSMYPLKQSTLKRRSQKKEVEPHLLEQAA